MRPWRWSGHNSPLGEWLLTIRDDLALNRPLTLGSGTPVRHIPVGSYTTAARTCLKLAEAFPHDSIVAIGRHPHDCKNAAGQLRGRYTRMETIDGKDMLDFAEVIDSGNSTEIAAETT